MIFAKSRPTQNVAQKFLEGVKDNNVRLAVQQFSLKSAARQLWLVV